MDPENKKIALLVHAARATGYAITFMEGEIRIRDRYDPNGPEIIRDDAEKVLVILNDRVKEEFDGTVAQIKRLQEKQSQLDFLGRMLDSEIPSPRSVEKESNS